MDYTFIPSRDGEKAAVNFWTVEWSGHWDPMEDWI